MHILPPAHRPGLLLLGLSLWFASATTGFAQGTPLEVAILEPLEGAVLDNTFPAHATCSGPASGCTSLVLTAWMGDDDVQLATGTAHIQQDVSLNAVGNGWQFYLEAVGQAPGHAATAAYVTVFHERSEMLERVAMGRGTLVDFDDTRLLLRTSDGSMYLQPRSGGSATKIGEAASLHQATLTANGAAFINKVDSIPARCTPGYELWQSTGGASVKVTEGCSFGALQIAGHFAMWNEYEAAAPGGVLSRTRSVVRNLDTGVETRGDLWPVYEQGNGGGIVHEFALAPNGDVFAIGEDVLASPAVFRVLRLRAGSVQATAQLEYAGGISSILDMRADTDVLAVFRSSGLWAVEGASVSLVTATRPTEVLLAGGYMAYDATDANNRRQVWVRPPSGVATQRTSFEVSSFVGALDSTGSVSVVANFPESAPSGCGLVGGRGHYLIAAGQTPTLVAQHQSGEGRFLDGEWYLMLGGGLLAYTPSNCGGDPVDGGVSEPVDAGEPISDGGASETDGGHAALDGGAGEPDAGPESPDASVASDDAGTSMDGGSTEPPEHDGSVPAQDAGDSPTSDAGPIPGDGDIGDGDVGDGDVGDGDIGDGDIGDGDVGDGDVGDGDSTPVADAGSGGQGGGDDDGCSIGASHTGPNVSWLLWSASAVALITRRRRSRLGR